MADFQNGLISRIFGVFWGGFLEQNNYNALVESFFACFWHFYFFTQTVHFAKAIGFAWVIPFGKWPIFCKMVSFLEYLLVFGAVFCVEQF